MHQSISSPVLPRTDAARFLQACKRQAVDATPVWLMRQAGRYMSEYRALRERYGILEIIKTPELAAEVTLQPMRAFDLDAAIIFADILPPLEGMGLQLSFGKGEGPIIHNPLRTAADVAALQVRAPQESLGFTLEAIKLVRKDLGGVPLIGFSGAPFTLASYAIEGGGSRNYLYTKGMMFSEPTVWHSLMEKLSEVVGQYLLAQAQAGAQALQLFDSWVGALSPADYREYVLPYSKRAIEIARQGNVPLIHFGTNTSGMLDLIQEAGGDVIGVDWHIELKRAWELLGTNVAVQGNLDPVVLFAPWPEVERRVAALLDQVAGRPGHIFNLGHGILPGTPVETIRRLVDFVHEYSSK
ncbi:uroporphyrinogen decarboxylase [Tengunoibacter tsumagoiensis]|uniref:Uroporphyrinogen decarboxylase n=1 Tax=Tengunoibacter tsumagoiensis TaxID=2014871 RepID=A0A401ZZG1_9CHLR|nr:uroporphyrinogen decarboxylase [Tengunoibacter tsumagoiensis]GCE12192.1 uroporphyrinogen decarboxylase [Tengunoibacter tsumagoiensis]